MENSKGIDFEKSKTYQNLQHAFAGESMARNKYTYFASVAKKEGHAGIGKVFEETAENEKEHAKLWCKALDGIGDTYQNLMAAAKGENEEWTAMYKEFAEIAKEEGFDSLAIAFSNVGAIERTHEDRYKELAKNLEADTLYSSKAKQVWECANCGHRSAPSKEAPKTCPTCFHPQGYFFIVK